MSGIILYLFHRELVVVRQKADTRMAERMELNIWEFLFIKQFTFSLL